MTPDKTVEARLWTAYFAGPNDDTRNKLIEYYYGFMDAYGRPRRGNT